jgi:hypothetical protein
MQRVSRAEVKDPRNVPCTQNAYFSPILCTNVYIPVCEHFSFARIIHPLTGVAYQEAD